MRSSDIRGDDYRAKAAEAQALADANPLPQVRVRQEAAAAVWLGLAALEDRRDASGRAPPALRT